MHTFATNEKVRATWLRSLWNNMNEIHTPEGDYIRADDNNTAYSITTSSTFVDVDAEFLQATVQLDVSARLLISANIVMYASAGDTVGQLSLVADGIPITIAETVWMDQPNLHTLSYVTDVLAPGEHSYKIQHRRLLGTGTINTAIFSRHWFYVVQI